MHHMLYFRVRIFLDKNQSKTKFLFQQNITANQTVGNECNTSVSSYKSKFFKYIFEGKM